MEFEICWDLASRKPVLLVDGKQESNDARRLLDSEGIEYLIYDASKFEDSCCGELPSTKAPSVFAPEGLYKGIEGIKTFLHDRMQPRKESESAFW